ncbi:MAG: arginine--tRNA ligase, partial [Thermoplasmata archaeon]
MERIRNSIKESLEREIRSKFSIKLSVLLEIPSGEHGDFAYPLYDLLKLLKKSPEEIGKKLIEDLRIDNVSKIELSGNYVNFYVDYTSISQAFIEEIWRKGKEALSFERKNKKVILEHTSANPTGPIHVGRARNPIIGDTIGRLMKKCGYDVEIQYYVNDAGKQSATLVYGYRNLKIETNDEKIDHRLVHYYQKANDLLENDEKVKMEIEKIMKEVEGGNKELIMENREILGNVLKGIEKTLS